MGVAEKSKGLEQGFLWYFFYWDKLYITPPLPLLAGWAWDMDLAVGSSQVIGSWRDFFLFIFFVMCGWRWGLTDRWWCYRWWRLVLEVDAFLLAILVILHFPLSAAWGGEIFFLYPNSQILPPSSPTTIDSCLFILRGPISIFKLFVF